MKISLKSISRNALSNILFDYGRFKNHVYLLGKITSPRDNPKGIVYISDYFDSLSLFTGESWRFFRLDTFPKIKYINLKKPYTSTFKRGVRIRIYGD